LGPGYLAEITQHPRTFAACRSLSESRVDPATYIQNIRDAYEGEIVSERVFRTLAAQSQDPETGAKLNAIADVEARTHAVLSHIAARLGIAPSAAELTAEVDQRVKELAGLSWPDFVRHAVSDWPRYIELFSTLEKAAAPGDESALRRLVEHERALVAFAGLENAGAGFAESGAPLRAYLQRN
jgi:hypothetical protein